MKAKLTLRWNGPAVSKAVKKATLEAENETLANAVALARGFVRVDTGTLQADIKAIPAQTRGQYIQGTFGAYTVPYAIFQEIGTVKMTAQPYIRPAADIEFPRLAERIRRRLQGG